MRNTLFIVAIIGALAIGYFGYMQFINPASETDENGAQGKLDINAACEAVFAGVVVPYHDAAAAARLLAECKEGKHPEVIEQYKAQMNLGDGAAI